MRASAEQDPPALGLCQQILFMTEILGNQHAVFLYLQAAVVHRVLSFHLTACIKCQSFPQNRIFPGKPEPWMSLKGNIKANITFRAVEMRFKGVTADPNRRSMIPGEKGFQPAAVIVMPMRKNCRVNQCQVNAKPFRILCKSVALPHIKQYDMGLCLYQKAQAVLRSQITLC